jgi:glutamate racemase
MLQTHIAFHGSRARAISRSHRQLPAQALSRPGLRARSYHATALLFLPKKPVAFSAETCGEVSSRTRLTEPPRWKDISTLDAEYKPSTRQIASQLEQLVMVANKRRKENGKSETGESHHLVTAFDVLLEANKILIFGGQNTASGKVQPNGAVAAAVLMNTLNRVKKVPVLVSDEINYRLTRCLLHPVNPECARYAAHETLHNVNGELVRQLANLIIEHQPDAAVFIGIPGRNAEQNYLDEDGNHLDDFNVALDQALELCHRAELPTIAICSAPNQAGMGNQVIEPETVKQEKAHAVQGAACTIIAEDVAMGSAALSELVARAYLGDPVCDGEALERMIRKANEKTETDNFRARQVRHTLRHRHQADVARKPMNPEHCVAKLKEMQQAIDNGEVVWPRKEELQRFRDYGPEVKYFVLYDSSDGALIALEDFVGYLNARSNVVYDITVVTDHLKASYGDQGKKLFSVVVDGLHYSAMLGPDGIVMLCNTACSKNLRKVIEIIEKVVGRKVHVIDLIDTTAEAIVKYGGDHAVILCTQGAAENEAYPPAVAEKAKKLGLPMPKLTVVACGDRNNPNFNGYDLANIINHLLHQSDDPDIREMAMRAIRHYMSQVPVNATKIFLCCTHYPWLKDLLAEIIEEFWTPRGRSGPVPFIDPVKYQADRTAAFLAETVTQTPRKHGAPRSDNKHFLPRISVQTTTGDISRVRRAVERYAGKMEVLNQYTDDEEPNLDLLADEDALPRKTTTARETNSKAATGITVSRVNFAEVPLKDIAHQFGVDEYGNLCGKSEPQGNTAL